MLKLNCSDYLEELYQEVLRLSSLAQLMAKTPKMLTIVEGTAFFSCSVIVRLPSFTFWGHQS